MQNRTISYIQGLPSIEEAEELHLPQRVAFMDF